MVPKNPLKKLEQMVLLATLQQLVDAARAMVASLAAKLTYQRKNRTRALQLSRTRRALSRRMTRRAAPAARRGTRRHARCPPGSRPGRGLTPMPLLLLLQRLPRCLSLSESTRTSTELEILEEVPETSLLQ